MRIDSSLIEASIARARHNKLDPQELKAKIGEGDRSHNTTTELRERRYRQFLAETGDQVSAHQALERILEGNDLSPINYLSKGLNAARSVCRIHLKNTSGETIGFGTGFLVAPCVLMTNHHVISGVEDAKGALAEFDYELDIHGKEKPLSTFAILTDPPPIAIQQLDFCLVGVSSKSDDERRDLSDFGWLPLNPNPGKAIIGEYLTIIQHPSGERKQICVRENKLLRYDLNGDTLWYATDTVAGSSGSPVFNNSWQVVALHHSGVPKTDAQGHWLTTDNKLWDHSMDESRVAWIANEGIRISKILAYLSAKFAEHSLAKAMLTQPVPPISVEKQLPTITNVQRSEFVDGELRVTVPVQISVRIGERLKDARGTTSISTSVQPAGITNTSDMIEKVNVDQSNYENRTGFNPDFLGTDTLRVPLPVVKDATLKRETLSFTYKGTKGTEVKYWNYSVIMHKSRKLAIYSAVNVDTNQRPDNAGRDGDRWYSDPRVGDEYEIDARFYKEQSNFEADRSLNPFDRGHLTRRLDAQWGESEEIAKSNGDDSFHWTNCSPQHWQLNQGKKRWLGLEDFVIKTFAKDTGRACVINGPVFDAPLSHRGQDENMVPDIQGNPHKDPIFGDVAIPKLFFKVVACEGENGKLRVAAFLMSQEDFLRTVDRLKGMPPLQEEILTPIEARLYQIKVTDLETLTGLDFGPLSSAEVSVEEKVGIPTVRIIESFEDIRM